MEGCLGGLHKTVKTRSAASHMLYIATIAGKNYISVVNTGHVAQPGTSPVPEKSALPFHPGLQFGWRSSIQNRKRNAANNPDAGAVGLNSR